MKQLIKEARRMQQLAGIIKEDLTNDCIVMTLPLGDTASATIQHSSKDALSTAKDIFNHYKKEQLDELTLKELDTDFYVVESESAGDESFIVGSKAPSSVEELAYNAWGEYGDDQRIVSDIPEDFWDDMFDQVDMREGSAKVLAQYTQPDPYGDDDEGYEKIPTTDFSMNEVN